MPKATSRQLDHSGHRPGGNKYGIALVLDSVSDPLNVGSLFRLADALGIEHLYLCGSTPTPPHKSMRKTSRGTESLTPHTYYAETLDAIAMIQSQRYECIVLEVTSTSKSIYSLELTSRKVALILGSEESGVSESVLAKIPHHVHIDMEGVNSSMNVAAAAAIGIYECVRQKRT